MRNISFIDLFDIRCAFMRNDVVLGTEVGYMLLRQVIKAKHSLSRDVTHTKIVPRSL